MHVVFVDTVLNVCETISTEKLRSHRGARATAAVENKLGVLGGILQLFGNALHNVCWWYVEGALGVSGRVFVWFAYINNNSVHHLSILGDKYHINVNYLQ